MSKSINFINNSKNCLYCKNKNGLINYSSLNNNLSLSSPPTTTTLSSIYHDHPPGFENYKKTANAVSNMHLANADTGATGTYIATRDMKCLQNVQMCNPTSQIHVQVANGETIASSHVRGWRSQKCQQRRVGNRG